MRSLMALFLPSPRQTSGLRVDTLKAFQLHLQARCRNFPHTAPNVILSVKATAKTLCFQHRHQESDSCCSWLVESEHQLDVLTTPICGQTVTLGEVTHVNVSVSPAAHKMLQDKATSSEVFSCEVLCCIFETLNTETSG